MNSNESLELLVAPTVSHLHFKPQEENAHDNLENLHLNQNEMIMDRDQNLMIVGALTRNQGTSSMDVLNWLVILNGGTQSPPLGKLN